MKNEVILGSAYLAPVEYYTKLFAYPSVRVERYDHYMKQTYRNRCVIASAVMYYVRFNVDLRLMFLHFCALISSSRHLTCSPIR